MCLKTGCAEAERAEYRALAETAAAQKAYIKKASTGEITRMRERAHQFAAETRFAIERIAANLIASYAQAELAERGVSFA